MAIFNPEGQPQPNEDLQNLTQEEYNARLKSGDLPGQTSPESAAPGIIVPGPSGEIISREANPDVLKDDAEKREEERRKMEEDSASVKGFRPTSRSVDEIPIFGTPGKASEAPAEKPKLVLPEQPSGEMPGSKIWTPGSETMPPAEKPGIITSQPSGEIISRGANPNILKEDAEKREEERRKEAEINRVEAPTMPQEKGKSVEGMAVRTPEQQEKDKIKAEAEAKKQLEDRLIEIRSSKPASEQERTAFIEEAGRIYEQLKKGDLKAAAEAKARENAAQDGLRIMTKQEFLARENEAPRMEKRMAGIRARQNELALQTDWQISQENPDRPGVKRYDSYDDFKKAIDAKKAELAQHGITMPDGVMEELINQGYRVDDIKVKKGWFGLGKVKTLEIPTVPLLGQEGYKKPGVASYKPEDLAKLAARVQERNTRRDQEDAQFEISRVLSYGQRAWKNKKQEAAGDVLRDAVQEIQEERKPKPEAAPATAEKPKLEKLETIAPAEFNLRQIAKLIKMVESSAKSGKNDARELKLAQAELAKKGKLHIKTAAWVAKIWDKYAQAG